MKTPLYICILQFILTAVLAADFAVINDKDGYTNVRSGKSIKSKVIDKVVDGQVFTAYLVNQEWVEIFYEKEAQQKKGYIHKSRIQYIEKAKTYTGKDLTFAMITQPFSKEGKVIGKNENGGVGTIDGRKIYGVDGGLPSTEIKEVKFTLNGKALKVDKKLYSNLYQPSPDSFVIKKIKNHFFVFGFQSDGAGGYMVVWTISPEGIVSNSVDSF